jgi:4-diphosphocytidyl-2-C-methyl-D-erythritol kinase
VKSGSADDTQEPAPAKINLALHVLGKRPDGYHDIDSLVVFTDLGDSIALADAESPLALSVDGPFAAELKSSLQGRDNIVLAAAQRLAAIAGDSAVSTGLRLTKNLPPASGLGGGSADAAAALRLLHRHWRISLPIGALADIGAEIGADVPMCLASVPLRATGKGERLAEVPGLPALPVILAFPSAGVSTARIFERAGDGTDRRLPRIPAGIASPAELAAWLRQTRNGLEDAAVAELPAIREALDLLTRARDSLFARMSGSGSCCFGLFPDLDAAKLAAGAIRAARPSWWVKATMTAAS